MTDTSKEAVAEYVAALRPLYIMRETKPSDTIKHKIADLLEALAAERDALRAMARSADAVLKDYEATVRCIPVHHLLDPPDGGDVPLHEGIARYAASEHARGHAEGLAKAAVIADTHGEIVSNEPIGKACSRNIAAAIRQAKEQANDHS